MLHGHALLGSVLTALLVSCAAPGPDEPGGIGVQEERFEPLFNGYDLTGWIQRGGYAVYRVEEGCIVGATRPHQPNSFLCTTETFGDFVLELEFFAERGTNSGIQVRSESRAEYQEGRVHGYQVEIDTTERAWTGGIYDESRRGWIAPLEQNEAARRAFKQNEWNHLRVEAVGDRLRTWVNGVPAADLRDSMTPRGFIGLQVHSVGGRENELVVKWRDIRVRRLDARPPT